MASFIKDIPISYRTKCSLKDVGFLEPTVGIVLGLQGRDILVLLKQVLVKPWPFLFQCWKSYGVKDGTNLMDLEHCLYRQPECWLTKLLRFSRRWENIMVFWRAGDRWQGFKNRKEQYFEHKYCGMYSRKTFTTHG